MQNKVFEQLFYKNVHFQPQVRGSIICLPLAIYLIRLECLKYFYNQTLCKGMLYVQTFSRQAINKQVDETRISTASFEDNSSLVYTMTLSAHTTYHKMLTEVFHLKFIHLIFQLFFRTLHDHEHTACTFLYRGPCLLCSRFVLFLWPYEIEYCSLTSYFISHL